jgi:hypothetical protein
MVGILVYVTGKGKEVKFMLEQTIKAQGWSRGIAVLFP